jgi:hypothetical protein
MRIFVNYIKKVKNGISRDPILLSVIVIVFLMLGYSGFELWRSKQYQSTAEEYKKSAKVQNVITEIDRLSKALEEGNRSLLCDLSVDKTLQAKKSEDTYSMLQNIREYATQLQDSWPSFKSAALYMTEVQDSRAISGDIDSAMSSLFELSELSAVSGYCYELNAVLSESEFLAHVSKSEGVSALFVGQIENFWVNFEAVQQKMKAIRPVPAEIVNQHNQLLEIYDDIAVLLREDTQDVELFSRNIKEKLTDLEIVFADIKQVAEHLEALPEQLQIQSAVLR